MTNDLTPTERRIIVRHLEAELEHCHVWDCAKCRQLRRLITKLEDGEDE